MSTPKARSTLQGSFKTVSKMICSPKRIFSGTAQYYQKFRVPYPEKLLRTLIELVRPSGAGLLVDLGCGTGQLSLPLSAFFGEVHAVDLDSEMIHFGKEQQAQEDHRNIRWYCCRAEDHVEHKGSVELVTIGAAFHWMDRRAVARLCRRWLSAEKSLAVMGYNSGWTGVSEPRSCSFAVGTTTPTTVGDESARDYYRELVETVDRALFNYKGENGRERSGEVVDIGPICIPCCIRR